MTIEIGDKPLSSLSQENIRQIVIMVGCCASLEYWSEPIITYFSNKMFSDTITVDFHSYSKSDNRMSREIVFFFNFKEFSFHYHDKYEDLQRWKPNGRNVKLNVIKYLIKEGFDVPIY